MSKALSRYLVPAVFGFLWMGLAGASCSKAKATDTEHPQNKPDSGPPAVEEALPGVNVDQLSPDERQAFFHLVDKAESPCGKAHSLRTSLKEDKDCRRSIFAARYLVKWVKMGAEESEALQYYQGRYAQKGDLEIETAGAPYEGAPGAPVKIVEFFDYTCPHCKKMLPVLEDVVAEFPSDVVIYYRFFPLTGAGHEASKPCAQAAVAAMKQGKFREMHKKLFSMQEGDQSEEAIFAAAKEMGLDMTRFEADFRDPATKARVEYDKNAGEKLQIDGTPAIYINGRNYPPIIQFDEIKDWIDEELAVNR